MEKQKKSVGTIALVVLLLIVTVVSLILATYAWAKYTTTTGPTEATANVAKWNVTFTPANNTFTGSYTHVSTGKIAPGTSGTFTVEVVPGSTEVCFDYTITKTEFKLVSVSGDNETDLTDVDLGNGITGEQVVSHISLTCGDVNFKTTPIKGRFELNEHADANNVSVPGNIVDNSIAVGNVARAGGVYTFTWNWPYDNGDNAAYDAIDTAAGEYAATHDLRLKVAYQMTATQTEPNGNHVN